MLDPRILWLVEDDLEDGKRIGQVLQEISPAIQVVHLRDCESALRCLQTQPGRRPCLILLALNAPAGTAFHFLEMVKADEMLKTIPVIALANSRDEHDVSAGYELGLAGYIVKSDDWAGLCREMAAVWDYWAMNLVPPTS